jgi:hypothetical protein
MMIIANNSSKTLFKVHNMVLKCEQLAELEKNNATLHKVYRVDVFQKQGEGNILSAKPNAYGQMINVRMPPI